MEMYGVSVNMQHKFKQCRDELVHIYSVNIKERGGKANKMYFLQ